MSDARCCGAERCTVSPIDFATRYWEQLHPEIADEHIEAPIVVVGMMRSGTTLVQRVLARDPRHLCVFGWEASEPAPRLDWDPSAPDPRVTQAIASNDQLREFAAALYAIHPMHAREPEEEIMFFADAFLSHVPEASCDVPEYRAWLDTVSFRPAYTHLHRTLRLLQWQKCSRGESPGRWILKTPQHLGYLDTLVETFPDAHIVHLHRDPVDVIASGASLNTTLWQMHADAVDPKKVGRLWLERMGWTNDRAMRARDAMNDRSRFTDIWFRDAVADPIGQIERVYHAIGLDLTPEARDQMGGWLHDQASRDSASHHYSPEQFGLTPDEINDRFAEYIERFVSPHHS